MGPWGIEVFFQMHFFPSVTLNGIVVLVTISKLIVRWSHEIPGFSMLVSGRARRQVPTYLIKFSKKFKN